MEFNRLKAEGGVKMTEPRYQHIISLNKEEEESLMLLKGKISTKNIFMLGIKQALETIKKGE